jgi:hypothetical protein
VGVTGTIGDYRALSLQDIDESARQSECASWLFVLVLSNGQKDHSVQQPEGDEVRRISFLATPAGKRANSRSYGPQP